MSLKLLREAFFRFAPIIFLAFWASSRTLGLQSICLSWKTYKRHVVKKNKTKLGQRKVFLRLCKLTHLKNKGSRWSIFSRFWCTFSKLRKCNFQTPKDGTCHLMMMHGNFHATQNIHLLDLLFGPVLMSYLTS